MKSKPPKPSLASVSPLIVGRPNAAPVAAAPKAKDPERDRLDQGGGQESGGGPADPTQFLAPVFSEAEAQRAQLGAAQALAGLSPRVLDEEARALLDRGRVALEQTLRMSAVEAPSRIAVTTTKSSWSAGGGHPSEVVGWIQRDVGGPPDKPRSKARLFPRDRSLRPIKLADDAIEGLRSGAMVKLELEKTDGDALVYRVRADDSAYASSFLAHVVIEGDRAVAVGLPEQPVFRKVPLSDPGAKALAGKQVIVDVERPESSYRTGVVRDVIGADGSRAARLTRIAVAEGASIGFSAAAMKEVREILAKPLTGKDLRHIPFITIDNDNSKDLDQALAIERRADGGFDVHYAIADVTYFVRRGGALDREARHRAETLYFAGRNEPMFPRELSEGRISLLPNEDKRAFVVSVSLDKDGKEISRRFERGIIQSRAKLSYRGVQAYFDLPAAARQSDPLYGKEYSESLELLREVGLIKMRAAEARGVTPSDDFSASVRTMPDGSVKVAGDARFEVERWNEQISLLANEAVARELRLAGLKALYRAHPPPSPERLMAFRSWVAGLDRPWPESQSLAAYLHGLDPKDRRTPLIHSQAIRCNSPAYYSTEPKGHSGLKLDDYLHFTAPMRRYTDVRVAEILAAHVEGRRVPYQAEGDHALDQVAKLAESAKLREKNIARRISRVLAAELWQSRLGQVFDGTVAAVRPSGLTVRLDDGLMVEVRATTLQRLAGEPAPPVLEAGGTRLVAGSQRYQVGGRLRVAAVQADPVRELLEIAIAPAESGPG
ncbi:MAG: RNB domain-containing ribonuclease [Deltaproteobacteria bacterium]|nr:RNB domain-containing ribonuclease [Deltaproteobacteria bacterium]